MLAHAATGIGPVCLIGPIRLLPARWRVQLPPYSVMTDPIITATDLTIGYGSTVLLDQQNFEVPRGTVFVILGGSGCGKSSLLKNMIGLYKPLAGDITINGRSIVQADENEWQEIYQTFGVLYQSGALFGSMTLLANVTLPLQEHTDLPDDIIESIARLKLASVGLDGFEDFLPNEISGGMKKRAGLARALALDAELLFLDEPSAGLDPISAAELDELILDLRDHFGVTVVIVTHELDSIYSIADTCIMLHDQKIIARGKPAEIAKTHADAWVREFFTRAGTKTVA